MTRDPDSVQPKDQCSHGGSSLQGSQLLYEQTPMGTGRGLLLTTERLNCLSVEILRSQNHFALTQLMVIPKPLASV